MWNNFDEYIPQKSLYKMWKQFNHIFIKLPRSLNVSFKTSRPLFLSLQAALRCLLRHPKVLPWGSRGLSLPHHIGRTILPRSSEIWVRLVNIFQSQIARLIKRRINGRIQNLGQARGPAFSTISGNTTQPSQDISRFSMSLLLSWRIFSMERYGKALRVQQQSTSRCFDIQPSIPSILSIPPSRPGSRKGSPWVFQASPGRFELMLPEEQQSSSSNYNIVFPEQMLQGTVEGAPENHQWINYLLFSSFH